MRPLVTILIPTYKRAEYLREAIRSALAQTHRILEILVLDDASPDHTPDVVAEFAGDSRLRYLRHPRNRGIVGNWRAGIEAVQGEFFCFLHDDDTFEPTFVEALLAPLERDEHLILAFCDHWVMDAQGRRLTEDSASVSARFGRDRLSSGHVADFPKTALVESSIPVGATLFRRNEITSNMIDDRAQGAIDSWLFYQCVKTGRSAYYLPERLMNYRVHPNGMSSGMPIYMAEGHLFRYRAILNDPAMTTIHPAVRQLMAAVLTGYGINLIVQGDTRRALTHLLEAFRLRASLRGFAAFWLACSGRLGVRAIARLKANH